jgi:hypothetical protein
LGALPRPKKIGSFSLSLQTCPNGLLNILEIPTEVPIHGKYKSSLEKLSLQITLGFLEGSGKGSRKAGGSGN